MPSRVASQRPVTDDAGITPMPQQEPAAPPPDRTVQESCAAYAAGLEVERRDGSRPPESAAAIERRLGHIVDDSRLASTPVLGITLSQLEDYQDHKVREREHLADLRERRLEGGQLTERELGDIEVVANKGLGNLAINKSIAELARVVDREIERSPYASGATANPCRTKTLKLVAEAPRGVALTIGQTLSLLEGAAERDAERGDAHFIPRELILRTLLCTGMQYAELASIRREDVLPQARILQLNKGKADIAQRDVNIPTSLADALEAWMAIAPYRRHSDLVFPTRTGLRRDLPRLREIVVEALERAAQIAEDGGREPMPQALRSHARRKTFCSLSYQVGKDVPWVTAAMGERSYKLSREVYEKTKGKPVTKSDWELLSALLDW